MFLQLSQLDVPVSAEFAARFKEMNEKEKAEKEKMKKMTLDIHDRQEEEEYHGESKSIHHRWLKHILGLFHPLYLISETRSHEISTLAFYPHEPRERYQC